MADSALGELRRPSRPIEQRIERIARWRAQGLDAGESDTPFPGDVTDATSFAGADSGSGSAAGSGVAVQWLYDEFDLTAASASSFALSAIPVENSEVVRVNGLVLAPSEYTIAGSVLTLDDIAAVRLGIGSDTWRLVLNYAYTATAPQPTVTPTAAEWTLNGDAVLAGSDYSLSVDGAGSQASSMVSTVTVPSGWSTLAMTVVVDLAFTSAGDGFVFGVLDAVAHDDTFLGGSGSDRGFYGAAVDATFCVADINTYSALASGSIHSQVDDSTTENVGPTGTFFAAGTNTYVLTLDVTTTGRAHGILTWNGVVVTESTTDLYVPDTLRFIVTAGCGAFTQDMTVTSVSIETDGATDPVIAVPGGTYTPPTPPSTPGTHVLRYQRPDTTGYTSLDVTAGGTFNLDNTLDYAITASAPIDSNYVRLVGGRNLDIYGLVFDFDASVPTGSYDADRRGLHIKDGPNPDLKRVIYCEGVWLRSGYYSDGIQLALRHENDVTFICQALRSDAYGWGQRSGVHSDLIQFYGGPLNFFGDCITGKYQTYQGIFMRPADTRSLPSGADKADWQLSRVNLESGTGPGGDGAHYLLWDDQPSWTNLTLDEVYIDGGGNDVTDSHGNIPSTGLFQNATPSGGDWAPSSWWTGDTYNSPGYV